MLLFDNKACRFAMAVEHFSTSLGLLHIRSANPGYAEKHPTAPYLKASSMGGEGAYLKMRLDGCLKYAPSLVFVVKA
jgi:hypothetical protein